MGTRSTIALEFADGTVEQVYCHWDGYLENNGKILYAHYSDPFKLKELLALGAFSSLRDTVEVTKETAYHFSRGEELVIERYKTADEYFDTCAGEEYDYILRNVEGVATWFVRHYSTNGVWVALADELAEHLRKSAEEETLEA
jgi:hypothetical protein